MVFSVLISSDLNHERLVADILFDDQLGSHVFGLLSQESGFESLDLEVFAYPPGGPWSVALAELQNVLSTARVRLSKHAPVEGHVGSVAVNQATESRLASADFLTTLGDNQASIYLKGELFGKVVLSSESSGRLQIFPRELGRPWHCKFDELETVLAEIARQVGRQ